MIMKRTLKTIGVITIMGTMLIGAYLLGTTKARDMDSTSEEFKNNYVDMRNVVEFKTDGNGLQLYYNDGSGYYWER